MSEGFIFVLFLQLMLNQMRLPLSIFQFTLCGNYAPLRKLQHLSLFRLLKQWQVKLKPKRETDGLIFIL